MLSRVQSTLILGLVLAFSIASASERAYLGVELVELTQDICDEYETNDYSSIENGVIIFVAEGGPAYRAGLRHGDVLVMLDSIPIRSPKDAVEVVSSSNPGQSFVAVVLRHGLEVSVTGNYEVFEPMEAK